MKTHLLIIDPQIDFCDPNRGTLYVPGAEHDITRLAEMLNNHSDQIDAVHVTLDSHHVFDIAHPVFWKDAEGAHPAPFTIIHSADIEAGRWQPVKQELYERALSYAKALESDGRYDLIIWPLHCLIGSEGHGISQPLFDALKAWEAKGTPVNYVHKGENPLTEHYSAIKAEVPDPADPATQPNTALLASLKDADTILIAGEAASHCVANTVRDIAAAFGSPEAIRKIVLLTNATSPVTGFEGLAEKFVQDLKAMGMRTSTTAEWV